MSKQEVKTTLGADGLRYRSKAAGSPFAATGAFAARPANREPSTLGKRSEDVKSGLKKFSGGSGGFGGWAWQLSANGA